MYCSNGRTFPLVWCWAYTPRQVILEVNQMKIAPGIVALGITKKYWLCNLFRWILEFQGCRLGIKERHFPPTPITTHTHTHPHPHPPTTTPSHTYTRSYPYPSTPVHTQTHFHRFSSTPDHTHIHICYDSFYFSCYCITWSVVNDIVKNYGAISSCDRYQMFMSSHVGFFVCINDACY